MEIDKNIALKIEELYVEYKVDKDIIRAVNGINITIPKGKTVGLVGETGAGKTTTGLSVLRLVPDPPGRIVKGKIYLNGMDVLSLSENEMEKIRGNNVSMIFQDPMTSLNPVLTVEDQIAEVIKYHDNFDKAKSVEKAREMLELVGIPGNRGTEYPHQFSGGMKQRVVIAIALACNPDVLIADEPTTALDVTIQAQVIDMMKSLREKYNMAMLLITHDLGVVAEICDEVSVVYAGRIVEHGTLDDVYNNTRHPYTEGLFDSLPNIENRESQLKPIHGLMPDPSNLPKGCPFHPRCNYAMDICSKEEPGIVQRTENHYIACHLYDEENVKNGGVIKR